jgi:hypothetical protein
MENSLLINESQSWINKKEKLTKEIDRSVFGEKLSLAAKLFGCWHRNISRPFKKGRTAYRCCLECGARKRFNPETLETYGAFYFPPSAVTAISSPAENKL